MSGKSLKFFGPPTTKWRPFKIFMKVNGSDLLMAKIFKLHKYQTFVLMKNAWYEQNLICQEYVQFVIGLRLTGRRKYYFLIFAFFIFSNFKWLLSKIFWKTILFYNGFRGFLRSSITSQIFLIYTYLPMKR